MPASTAPTRCEHVDGVGQRCLRPAGHGATMEGWFTDGSANAGHDYGGVARDSRTSTEWALLKPAVRGNTGRGSKPAAARPVGSPPPGPLNLDSLLDATTALGVIARATDLDTRIHAWLDEQRRIHAEQGGIIRDVVARDGFNRHELFELISMLHDIMDMIETDEPGSQT